MSSSFRTSKWDPVLIIAQMAAVQSLNYILFKIRTDTGFGWSLIIVWMVNAFLCIPILMWIVQRAKLILDFVLTFHFFHMLLAWKTIGHFPTGMPWWILQIVTIAIMTFGGEWACMHREMKPIMISQKPTREQQASSSSSTADGSFRNKRKVSDVSQKKETSETIEDQGPLLAAVGKAKKVLLPTSNRTKRHGKQKYDQIPLNDLDPNSS
ncbi:integral membrane protein S linking to the trans Golgi network-domain-containing protein [Choanephora cucurbitarum]|nr:integral membrane protein S linking to the trans Golgi network-domain-containing protein [Choanephora cucurbitarum]